MYTFGDPRTPRAKKLVYFALIFSTFIYGFLFLALAVFVFSLRMPAGITRWATAEAICIWGLMATFLASDWRLFASGWVLSLIAYALAFPSAEEQTTAP